jgi:hypothetical protein
MWWLYLAITIDEHIRHGGLSARWCQLAVIKFSL